MPVTASKTEKVKLEEVERDRQIKLAEIERDKSLSLADKEAARLKIERAHQIKLLQEQTRSRMAEAEQQAGLKELENEMQLRLIDKDNERINLVRDAQQELIQMQTMSQIAIEKAQTEGFTERTKQFIILQEKMTEIAQKRIEIIASCSLPIIKDIENFYNEVGEKISERGDEYNTKKLPQLLAILRQYDKDSPEHEIYSAQIRADMERQGRFIEEQMARVHERQNLVMQSFISSREKILEQTGQITERIAEKYLSAGQSTLPALPNADLKQLPPAD